jgi:hypothetical protein
MKQIATFGRGHSLFIGPYPESFNKDRTYDYVITVSDTYSPISAQKSKRHYWFPVNECGHWDYAAFFGTKRILDNIQEENRKILIHCAAGAYRSPIVATAYLYSIGKINDITTTFDYNNYLPEMFEDFCACPRAPKKLKEFLLQMNQDPTYCISGVLVQIGCHKFISGKPKDKGSPKILKSEDTF